MAGSGSSRSSWSSGFSVFKSAMGAQNLSEYARRRFWQIYPPYIASLVTVLTLVVLRKISSGESDFIAIPKSLSAIIATLTLTTAPVSKHETINWVHWTLSYEIASYAFIDLTFPLKLFFGTFFLSRRDRPSSQVSFRTEPYFSWITGISSLLIRCWRSAVSEVIFDLGYC